VISAIGMKPVQTNEHILALGIFFCQMTLSTTLVNRLAIFEEKVWQDFLLGSSL
jgi:hypothetical protein